RAADEGLLLTRELALGRGCPLSRSVNRLGSPFLVGRRTQGPAERAQDAPDAAGMVADPGDAFDDGGDSPEGPAFAGKTEMPGSLAQSCIHFRQLARVEFAPPPGSRAAHPFLRAGIAALPLPVPVMHTLPANAER